MLNFLNGGMHVASITSTSSSFPLGTFLLFLGLMTMITSIYLGGNWIVKKAKNFAPVKSLDEGIKRLFNTLNNQAAARDRMDKFFSDAETVRDSFKSFNGQYAKPERLVDALDTMSNRDRNAYIDRLAGFLRDLSAVHQEFQKTADYVVFKAKDSDRKTFDNFFSDKTQPSQSVKTEYQAPGSSNWNTASNSQYWWSNNSSTTTQAPPSGTAAGTPNNIDADALKRFFGGMFREPQPVNVPYPENESFTIYVKDNSNGSWQKSKINGRELNLWRSGVHPTTGQRFAVQVEGKDYFVFK
jgi:hypothetical protein